MALRPPGALKAKRMAYEGVLPQRILDLLDKYFWQSLQTIYSKRSRFVRENYAQPEPMRKVMGKKAWARHQIWVAKNSKPRRYYPEEVSRGRCVPLEKLKMRLGELVKPKYRREKHDYPHGPPDSYVDEAALKYKLSKRTRKLTRILERFQTRKFNYNYEPESTVKPEALTANCSERTRVLAEPKEGPTEPKPILTKYGVVPTALQYVPTARTENLAKPKPKFAPREEEDELIVIEERELTENGVSTTAMKYKATAKILELAKPREPPPEPVPDFPYDDKPRTKYNVAANALKYKISDRILKMSKPRGD